MSSISFPLWFSKATALWRFVFGIWLLAALPILHGIVQSGHLSNAPALVSTTDRTSELGASERTDSPSLQPRALFRTILTEARSHASGRELSSGKNPPSAILPVSASLTFLHTIQQQRPTSSNQPRPKYWHAFKARAPPSIA